jgi:hypothetical protein
MTSPFRNVIFGTLDWHGIIIQVTWEKQRFVDHLQIETLDPQRAPLPITETGYRSHFIAKDVIDAAGGAEAYVLDWLNAASGKRGWAEQEIDIRQYALL